MISEENPLILGSKSPRRSSMLHQLGIPFEVLPASIDEAILPDEQPETYVKRIALEKLQAVRRVLLRDPPPHSGVVTADTTVVLDQAILSKPTSDDDALTMLSALAGRTHCVLTAYAILCPDGEEPKSRVVRTEVTMRSASRRELAAYVATGEGRDKAGAYGVQEKGAFLVESIRGSYTCVVGLPLCELVRDLQQAGLLRNFP